jgi:hypothetical protein
MPAMTVANLQRIVGTATLDGLDARDAQAAVMAMLAQPARAEEGLAIAEFQVLRNRGQLAAAARIARGGAVGGVLPPGIPVEVIQLLLEIGGDTEGSIGEQTAAKVNAWIQTPMEAMPFEPLWRYQAACLLTQWYLSRRNYLDAERVLGRFRAVARRAVDDGVAGFNSARESICVAIAEAWLAVDRQTPEALSRLRHLDSLAAVGYGAEAGVIESPLILARLWEAVGDKSAALRAIRRRPYHFAIGPLHAATWAREEGRIAALAGDREGAIRAYRKYLAIRVEPDPSLKPEVEQVRRELARLERESAGR